MHLSCLATYPTMIRATFCRDAQLPVAEPRRVIITEGQPLIHCRRREECVSTYVPKDQWDLIMQSVAQAGAAAGT